MQTEREREAKEFRAQGAEIAQKIRSTADKDVTVLLANANKKSEIMKGEVMVKEIRFLLVLLEETHNFLHFIEPCKLMKLR